MILSYFRTLFLYLVLIFAVRLMGKRQIGQMEPTEFVVTMLIADLASVPMQDEGIPLLSGLIPILASRSSPEWRTVRWSDLSRPECAETPSARSHSPSIIFVIISHICPKEQQKISCAV